MTAPATRVAELRKKDRKWLTDIGRLCLPNTGLAYPGISAKGLPGGPAHRLCKLGLIVTYYPHNPVHHDRWVITDKGRAVLAAGP